MMKKLLYFFVLISAVLVFQVSCSDDDPAPTPTAKSTATDILTFSIAGETGDAVINTTDHTVAVEVANGTALATLTPTFTLSAGASSSPATGAEGDYSSAKTITVTAEDGTTTQAWTVTVTEDSPVANTETDILTFTIPEETGDATIDATAYTVAIEVASGTGLAALTPAFTLSEGATSDPATGIVDDYTSAVTITITAEDGNTTQAWVVTVTEEGAAGVTTVVFGDGGTEKATAITDLVVDGATYDVEIKLAFPAEIFGVYPGTYAFNTNAEAVDATIAMNIALNDAGAIIVGELGDAADEGRYRIGYESFLVGANDIENTRFKTGIFEPASWREGAEETNLYNDEPVTWAVFTKK